MDTPQVRHRGIPRGIWYFVVPVLTFGLLSAVPFIHAGLRLRDRGVLLLAGVYAVGGAVAYTVLAVIPAEAQVGTDWRADAVLGLCVVLAGSACVLLVRLRRRVFSALPGHTLHSLRWSLYSWLVAFAAVAAWLGFLAIIWHYLPTCVGEVTECHQILGQRVSLSEFIFGPAGWVGLLVGLLTGLLQGAWFNTVESATGVDLDGSGDVG